METYKNTRTGEQATLIEHKELTVMLKIMETSEIKEIGSATFKRWWKPVPTVAQDAFIDPAPIVEAGNTPKTETAATEVQAAPMKLSKIVKKLEDIFDLLNKLYFEDNLERPVITVQSTPKFYGHCSTKRIWQAENEAYYEINIGAEFLNRASADTAAILCHEMVHLHCRMNDIDETCQKGRYHNKIFKREAEARDLAIGYDRAVGYSPTSPTESFKQKLRDAGFEMAVPFARHTLEKKRTADREKPHKYTCPACGQTVRSAGDLSLICGICEVTMSQED